MDIIPPDEGDLERYDLLLAPGLLHVSDDLQKRLRTFSGQLVLGPRTRAKTEDMQIPNPLPPQVPNLVATVDYTETLRPDMPIALEGGCNVVGYRESLVVSEGVAERTADGLPAVVRQGNVTYLAAMLDQKGLKRILATVCATAGIETLDLPDGLRRRCTDTEEFWFNYAADSIEYNDLTLPAAGALRMALMTDLLLPIPASRLM